MTDWRQEAENLTGDLERALEREKALQGKLHDSEAHYASLENGYEVVLKRARQLESKLGRIRQVFGHMDAARIDEIDCISEIQKVLDND